MGLFNRKNISKCERCGKKLKDKDIHREPDNTKIILCKNCFDKSLDKLIAQQGSGSNFVPMEEIPENRSLGYREIQKKKFNAYQNPGTDEADFSSYRTTRRGTNKTEYDKGRDRVKRILDKKDKDDK